MEPNILSDDVETESTQLNFVFFLPPHPSQRFSCFTNAYFAEFHPATTAPKISANSPPPQYCWSGHPYQDGLLECYGTFVSNNDMSYHCFIEGRFVETRPSAPELISPG
jgi:hypothetical protein